MEIYLQEEFAIEKPFAHTRSTARLFYEALQTQQIALQKYFDYGPLLLWVEEYIKGVVLEENSPEIVDFINQLVLSFFNVRGKKQEIVPEFDRYYNYLTSILQLQPRLVKEVGGCPSKLLKAQQLLEGKKFAEAQKVLEEIVVVFKKNEDVEQELQCELLLAECKANTCDLKQFKEHHAKNVVKKAEALGVELRGGSGQLGVENIPKALE